MSGVSILKATTKLLPLHSNRMRLPEAMQPRRLDVLIVLFAAAMMTRFQSERYANQMHFSSNDNDTTDVNLTSNFRFGFQHFNPCSKFTLNAIFVRVNRISR